MSSSHRKGQIGFLFLVFIFIIAAIVLLLTEFLIAKGLVATKSTITINMEVDDRGMELLSLMKSETRGIVYMKSLGNMTSVDYSPGWGAEVKATLDRMHESYMLTLQHSGMLDKVFSAGDPAGDQYTMEIPAPGARAQNLKAYVKLKR